MNVLIVDDETQARKRMRRLLGEQTDVVVVGESNSGRSALEALRTHQVDVVLLDVQMADLDGFDVVRAMPADVLPLIIFVTAHDRHAMRAFEVAALDYLVKPVRKERLLEALQRARALIESRAAATLGDRLRHMLRELAAEPGAAATTAAPARRRGASRVEVRDGDTTRFIDITEIILLEADGPLVRVRTAAGLFRIRATLSHVEEALDPDRFVRIHRSYIVNIAQVRELQPWFGGDAILVMNSGQKLKVSRTYRAQLRERLNAV